MRWGGGEGTWVLGFNEWPAGGKRGIENQVSESNRESICGGLEGEEKES